MRAFYYFTLGSILFIVFLSIFLMGRNELPFIEGALIFLLILILGVATIYYLASLIKPATLYINTDGFRIGGALKRGKLMLWRI